MDLLEDDSVKTKEELLQEIKELNEKVALLEKTKLKTREIEKPTLESDDKSYFKPESIISLEAEDIKEEELANIIDSQALQTLMDKLYAVTKMGIGIIDLRGNVLVGTGWQDICTKFHRINLDTLSNCIESDLKLSSGVKPGEFRAYKCKNNLWDIVTPIFIGKKHVGNVFLGQFFYEDEVPDYELFAKQADKYGFNKEEYLKALDEVPRWSREKVENLMGFYSKFAAQISQLGYSNLKLAKAIVEKEKTEEALRRSEEKYRNVLDNMMEGCQIIGFDWHYLYVNDAVAKHGRFSKEELLGHTMMEMYPGIEDTELCGVLKRCMKERTSTQFENKFNYPDGRIGWFELRVHPVSEGIFILSIDITKRKKRQKEILIKNTLLEEKIQKQQEKLGYLEKE